MNKVINGMITPTQFQVQGTNTAPSTAVKAASAGKFGSILASLSSHQGIQGQQATSEGTGLLDALTELLQLTTADDVMEFLQENGFDEEMLPEVIDGHLVFHDETSGEELLNILREMLPNFNELELVTETGSLVIPIQELFASLEEVAEDFLLKMEQGELQEQFTNEELVVLAAMMQLTVIEGPQTDLTLKQEHQLHALQEMLKTLGNVLNEGNVQEKNPLLPFQMQNNQAITSDSIKQSLESEQSKMATTKLPGQEAGMKSINMTQSGFSIPTSMGAEHVKLESEAQGNSRAEMLLKELQNIFKRANFGQTGGTNRISIKLYPEHLGQLRIELLQTNGILTARILASNALGKEMLESQLHQLRQAFLQQNVQVERIDISQMLTETPQHEKNHAFNEQFKQQQEQTNERKHEEDEEEAMTFNEYMIELEG